MIQTIVVAADHGGIIYKDRIAEKLRQQGLHVLDLGTNDDAPTDYPEFARRAATVVANGEADVGIVVCGSGIGVSIVANKTPGIRAANCVTTEMARLARQHNHANVLALGQRLMPWETAWGIVEVFLETSPDEDERHCRRVAQIHEPERRNERP